jgi:hypothetical protein
MFVHIDWLDKVVMSVCVLDTEFICTEGVLQDRHKHTDKNNFMDLNFGMIVNIFITATPFCASQCEIHMHKSGTNGN